MKTPLSTLFILITFFSLSFSQNDSWISEETTRGFWTKTFANEDEFWINLSTSENAVSFDTTNWSSDSKNNQHKRLIQKYKTSQIEDAAILIHTNQSGKVRINGAIAPMNISLKSPRITQFEAERVALSFFSEEFPPIGMNVSSQLIITRKNRDLPFFESNLQYSYKVLIKSEDPTKSRIIYINAENGSIIRVETDYLACDNGKSKTTYYDWELIGIKWFGGLRNKYYLRDNCRGSFVHTKTNSSSSQYTLHDNCREVWSNNPHFESAGLERFASTLHWGGEMTYDYYQNEHSRNSYDDAGGGIKLVLCTK